ncbi:hypothetical protein SAMN04488029_3032 [Reichenbachiella faecimaris]|uniref:Lipoprotein n=1 Tax=Reichenbachiella faecimaris TaxID=692418 RepID=A0A1W2GJ71_REIFA|nr:hypothetical protein [Reichenbachiella faecimaris]SMD36710.1 hypothetical protein SAMN04488029_3032 [Reichenbachiella faecimaris]
MKLLIRLTAIILGAVVTTGGLSSCKKDNEECCSWRYDGERYSYCEDDGSTKRLLDEYDASWNEFKDYVQDEYDADCG